MMIATKDLKKIASFSAGVAAFVWLAVSAGPVIAGTVIGSNLSHEPTSVIKTSTSGYGTYSYYDYEYVQGSCSGECTLILATAPGSQASVTQAGIATSASIRTNGTRSVNIRIARSQGGVTYQFVGETGFQTVNGGTTTLALPNVKVQVGDVVAVSVASKASSKDVGEFAYYEKGSSAFSYYASGSATPLGVTTSFGSANGTELLANFNVEGDDDGDGDPNTTDPDLDNDGLTNDIEAKLKSSATDIDTDDDGIADGNEDINHDGKVAALAKKYKPANTCKRRKHSRKFAHKFKKFRSSYLAAIETDPTKADTDGDKLADGIEKGASAQIAALGSIQGSNNVAKLDVDPKTISNPRVKNTDGDRYSKDSSEDKNKNGKLEKKKREYDPNKRDCRKLRRK